MTPTQRSLIRRSYFMRGTPAQIAQAMKAEFGWSFTVADIIRVWQDEGMTDPLFCQARPAAGFPTSDKTTLCERMVA